MIKEVCIGNYSDIPRMIKAGANRIELNADLAEGGLTPSFAVIKQSILCAHKYNIPIVVMLRPRGGNFVYTSEEFKIMKDDLQCISLLGADGVAFGCLTPKNLINKPQMSILSQMARINNLDAVMHMAFDEIPSSKQNATIDWLIKNNFKRILTHGGPLKEDINACLSHLKSTISYADNRIEILPGGGINKLNVVSITQQLSVNQAHGTKIVTIN